MGTVVGIDADIIGKYEVNSAKEYLHRLIAEDAIGKPLPKGAIVHHVDYNRANNTNSNLVVCPDQSYHMLLHARTRIIDMGGHPDIHKYCSYHKRLEERSEFSTSPSMYDGLYNMCRVGSNEYRTSKGYNRGCFNWKRMLTQQYRRALKSNKVQITWL